MATTLAVRPTRAEVRPHRPAIRVRPAPPLEPPADDERHPVGPAAMVALPVLAPQLPLELPGRAVTRAPRPGHPAPSRTRVARPARTGPTSTDPTSTGPTSTGPTSTGPTSTDPAPATPASADPDPPEPTAPDPAARLATRRFLAACLEVIGGYRPMSHLRPLCLPDAFALIGQRLGGRKGTGLRNLGSVWPSAVTPVVGRTATGAPPRTGRGQQTAPGDRVGVLRVQLGEPRPGIAEVAAVLSRGERVWAMALRLEARDGRWLCTHLEIV